MITKMFKLFTRPKTAESQKNFLEYPAAQKKQIIRKAIEGANERQLDLEKSYKASQSVRSNS